MPARAHIIAIRKDVADLGILISDIKPYAPQANQVLDIVNPNGAAYYLHHSMDLPGATVVDGNSFVSGSRTTFPIAAPAVVDVVGGGNDATATTVAEFGIKAYLRERVHVNPGGNDDFMTPVEAAAVSDQILNRVIIGGTLHVTDINSMLNGQLAGVDNSLDGTDGAGGLVAGSTSFGDLDELLQIIAGEVYRTLDDCILGDAAGNWLGLVAREALVTAGAAAGWPNGIFVAQGGFLTSTEVGYYNVPRLAMSGSIRGSVRGGILNGLIAGIPFYNPNFAYTAGAVTAILPRATDIDANALPASGNAVVCYVYDSNGDVVS